MKEFTQRYTIHEHGRGDCLRTAFACVLDKASPEEVPDFLYHDDGSERQDWAGFMHEWFRRQGYEYWNVNLQAVREGRELYPGLRELLDGYYVVSGRSPRNYPDGRPMHHAVVARGPRIELVHDPHPLRTFLAAAPEVAYLLLPLPQAS